MILSSLIFSFKFLVLSEIYSCLLVESNKQVDNGIAGKAYNSMSNQTGNGFISKARGICGGF